MRAISSVLCAGMLTLSVGCGGDSLHPAGSEGGPCYPNDTPTVVLACPVTCAALQADPDATLEAMEGCPSIPN